jgi:hypothetical protein
MKCIISLLIAKRLPLTVVQAVEDANLMKNTKEALMLTRKEL